VRQARQLIVAARRCLQDNVIGFGKYVDRVVGLLSARERRPQNRDNLLNWGGTVQLPEDRENRAIEFLPQRHPILRGLKSASHVRPAQRPAQPGRHIPG
jgi:hypothetical protein